MQKQITNLYNESITIESTGKRESIRSIETGKVYERVIWQEAGEEYPTLYACVDGFWMDDNRWEML